MINIGRIWNKYKDLPVQIRASFWFLVCSFLQKGISMISTPIFTRILTTGEYGQFNVFNSWLSIITIFVTLNLYAGVYTQGLVKFDKERFVFSSALQGLTTILVVCWTIIYFIAQDFWNAIFSLSTVQMIAMLVMIWTTTVFNFWASEQRVRYRYKALVVLTIAVSFAKPVVGVLFVILAEDKVTARILGLVLVELVGYTTLYFIQMYQGKQFFSAKFWKYALIFNIPLVPHYLSQTVLNGADRLMISSMIGDNEVGIYSLAHSISYIMILFNNALMQALSPWIYQKIKERKIEDIAPLAYTTLIFIAVVNLVLILIAPEAVAVFAPTEYYDAIWVIPPLVMSVYFMYSYDLFTKFAFYYENTKFIMIASVIGAGLNVVLNYIFIRWFGYLAAGYTSLFCYIIYCIGHYLFMQKVCDECCNGIRPYRTNIIIKIAAFFLSVGFSLLFTYNHPIIRYILIFTCFILILINRNYIRTIIRNLMSIKK